MTKPERIRPKTEASTIEPPTEWSPHSLYGLKRCNGSDDGRLELLSVIVGWMMREREWPAKLAVDEIGKALAAGVELYVLNDGDYAKLLPANHSFEYCPVKCFDEIDRTPADENVGLTGAITNLRVYWSNDSGFYFGAPKIMGQHVLDPLAVRLSDADLFWGYRRSPPESVVELTDGKPAGATKPDSGLSIKPAQASSSEPANNGSLKKPLPWWQTQYVILEMAQNIGEGIHAKGGKASQTAVAKEIAQRINAIEKKTGRTRVISWDSVRGPLNGWKFKPENS